MSIRTRFATFRQNPVARIGLLLVGVVFLIITPLLGPLPGPGGVFTFAIGAGLVLQNSVWARKRYVRFKKQRPKMGGWADWGLRRQSAKRRVLRDKDQQSSARKTGREN
jgi:hypothetical protein